MSCYGDPHDRTDFTAAYMCSSFPRSEVCLGNVVGTADSGAFALAHILAMFVSSVVAVAGVGECFFTSNWLLVIRQ